MAHRNPLIAVYPGTFDPMTLGHEDLMRRASGLFDKLLLAVAAGHHKRTMFTIAERLQIAEELASPYRNVEVMAFRGLLSDFVLAQGGRVVVRDGGHPWHAPPCSRAEASALQPSSGTTVPVPVPALVRV